MKYYLMVALAFYGTQCAFGEISGDMGGGWRFQVKGISRGDVRLNTKRDPKQIIRSSVVTSKSVSENTNDEYLRILEGHSYKGRDETPKFEFYLYNDAGTIIRQHLSIHEIQQILLQQSQSLGLKQLGWLIGRNDTSWYNSLTSTSKLPPGMTLPKEDILTSLVTKKIEVTTPMPMATNNIGNNSQVLGVIGKIQGIVASAQKESDEDEGVNVYNETEVEKDKIKEKEEINLDDISSTTAIITLNKNKPTDRIKTASKKPALTQKFKTKDQKKKIASTTSTTQLNKVKYTRTTSTKAPTRRTSTKLTTIRTTSTRTTSTRTRSTRTTSTRTRSTRTTSTRTTSTRKTSTKTESSRKPSTRTTTQKSSSTTTKSSTTTSTTTTTSIKTTKSATKTTLKSSFDLFELNMFSDIKPWKYIEDIPSDDDEDTSENGANEPDPFDDMFDLSMLKPQSPFYLSTTEVDKQTFRSTELMQAEDKTVSPSMLTTKNYDNSFKNGKSTSRTKSTKTYKSTMSMPLISLSTKRPTIPETTVKMKIVNGFIVGNSDRATIKQSKDDTNSWSWVDLKTDHDSSLEKVSFNSPSKQSANQEAVTPVSYDITTPKLRPHGNMSYLGTVEYIPNMHETPSNLAMIIGGKIEKPQTKIRAEHDHKTIADNVGSWSYTESSLRDHTGSVEIVPKSLKELLVKKPRKTIASVVKIQNKDAQSKNVFPTPPKGNLGLSITNSGLDMEKRKFVEINNDIGFKMYRRLLESQTDKNVIFSPLSAMSSLAMIFLGARSSTSWQINEIMKMDDITSFNPHLLYKDILSSIGENQHLFTSSSRKHLLISEAKNPVTDFYKTRVKYFFDAEVESVKFNDIKGKIRKINDPARRVNHKSVAEENHINQDLCPPMSLLSQNYFRGQFSPKGKVSSMKFSNMKQGRRLSTIPSLSWSGTLNAGYDQDLDAIGVEIPYDGEDVSLIIVSPGKITKHKHESLGKIEAQINTKSWEQLLKSFMSRNLELEIPIFQSQSLLELNETLIELGVSNAFSTEADFSGINGSKDLKLSSFVQSNKFSINANFKRSRGDFVQEARVRKIKRRRNKRNIEKLRYDMKFDKQFMYIVRHNPSGLLLYIGRYDPHNWIDQQSINQR